MMTSLVVGGDSMLGSALADHLGALRSSRRPGATFPYDLRTGLPWHLPKADVVYLVACLRTFKECELDPDAYVINVDAQVAIAAHFKDSHIVYVSSEAAEWPNQTAYGAQKRACEISLLGACGYHRLSVVRPKPFVRHLDLFCRYLETIGNERRAGTSRWEAPL